MKMNLAVYTAQEGYSWQPGTAFTVEELAQFKKCIGRFPSPDASDFPYGGVFLCGGRVVFYRYHVAKKIDFRGRDALYCVLGAVSSAEAAKIDPATLFASPEFAGPMKPFPTSVEVAESASAPDWLRDLDGMTLDVRITGAAESPRYAVVKNPVPSAPPTPPKKPEAPAAPAEAEAQKTSVEKPSVEKPTAPAASALPHCASESVVAAPPPPPRWMLMMLVVTTGVAVLLAAAALVLWLRLRSQKTSGAQGDPGAVVTNVTSGVTNVVDAATSQHETNKVEQTSAVSNKVDSATTNPPPAKAPSVVPQPTPSTNTPPKTAKAATTNSTARTTPKTAAPPPKQPTATAPKTPSPQPRQPPAATAPKAGSKSASQPVAPKSAAKTVKASPKPQTKPAAKKAQNGK